jgi:hypothetical protein
MKPKPLVVLKNFTVPVMEDMTLFLVVCGARHRHRILPAHEAGFYDAQDQEVTKVPENRSFR